jgi:hypothetical protein
MRTGRSSCRGRARGNWLGFWLSSATQSATEYLPSRNLQTVSQISTLEIHNLAHLEFLPIQQIEDQSLVFADKPG